MSVKKYFFAVPWVYMRNETNQQLQFSIFYCKFKKIDDYNLVIKIEYLVYIILASFYNTIL